MAKEKTKNEIALNIEQTANYINHWGKRERQNIVKELLGREQLYRQKFLPVEISDIIENEVRDWVMFKTWEKYDILLKEPTELELERGREEAMRRYERRKKEIRNHKADLREWMVNLIWLVRLLRNEIPLTERPPKNEKALKISEMLIETEKREFEREERQKRWEKEDKERKEREKEWEKEQERERIKKEVEQEIRQEAEAKEKKRQEREKERQQKEQKKAEKKRLENEKNEQIKQQLKEAKEYGKEIYGWLPQKAQDWIKIILLIIVISIVIWGLKYIIRFVKLVFRGVKYMFNFLKWIWNNIVEAINEVKKVFEKEKKTEEKEKNPSLIVEVLPDKKEEENENEEEL